jgi:hypothetical protein
MSYGKSGGGPAPAGIGTPKPIYRDPRTGGMTTKKPEPAAARELEAAGWGSQQTERGQLELEAEAG